MKRILLYITLLVFTQPAWATSIVILITPEYIIIGSDSKRLLLNASAQVAAEQSVCKIRSAGKYCYAFAGFTAASATSFSADSIVAMHLRNATNYQQAIEDIKKDIQAALYKELAYEKKAQPEAFSKLKTGGSPLLEVAILSLQDGAPQMQILGFGLGKGKKLHISSYQSSCPGDCPQQQQVYFMGSYNSMEQYLGKQKAIADPAALVEQLIKEQAKATPSSVGAPVHLAKYSAAGIEWIK